MRAQVLDAPRPTDLVAVVRQLAFVQIEPTAPIAPTADLVLWSRLGDTYEPEERRWGYYALPILHGDRLVGKLDAAADRDTGELVVNAIHKDSPFSRAVASGVRAELEDLARWLGLELKLP